MTNKYLKAEPGPKNSVIYFDDKGKKWICEKEVVPGETKTQEPWLSVNDHETME